MAIKVSTLPLWDDRLPLSVHFDEDFKPTETIMNTGGDMSSPFLPSLRAVDDARRAVIQMAAGIDRTRGRGSEVRCVCFQDAAQTRAVVVHIVAVRRDQNSDPVIQVRYKLLESGPAVTLGKAARDAGTILVTMKSGGTLCIIELSQRAQLILLGLLDGNRCSDRYALPPPAGDLENSFIACLEYDEMELSAAANSTARKGILRRESVARNGWDPKNSWRSRQLHFWRKRRHQLKKAMQPSRF